MERLDFHTLLLRAWHASISKKLPWVFGLVVAASSIMETRLQITLPEAASFDELMKIFSEKSSDEWSLLFVVLLSLFVIGIFGKSNLITSLSSVAGKTDPENYPRSLRAIGRNFFRALLLESLIFFLLLAIVGVLALPLWIASSHNPEAITLLITLGFLTLIPIAVITFFIRQYALFYLLLSPLRIRGAIETGAGLLSRFFFPSLLFGLFSFAITVLFTFCLNLVILSIAVLSEKASVPLGEAAISLAAGIVFFSWFAIFQQALWLAFFKAIAGTSDAKKIVTEKGEAFTENRLPETPPAQ